MGVEAGIDKRRGLATIVGPKGRSVLAGILGVGILGFGSNDLWNNIPEIEQHIVSQTSECSKMGGLSYRSLRDNAESLWKSPRHTLGDMLEYKDEIDCYRASRTNLDSIGLNGGLRSGVGAVSTVVGLFTLVGGLLSFPRKRD